MDHESVRGDALPGARRFATKPKTTRLDDASGLAGSVPANSSALYRQRLRYKFSSISGVIPCTVIPSFLPALHCPSASQCYSNIWNFQLWRKCAISNVILPSFLGQDGRKREGTREPTNELNWTSVRNESDSARAQAN